MPPATVRFAPSPTGRIHVGNARTALLNALTARASGGRFILRFDDTDAERSRREYADAIETDLAWLGLAPDLVVRQSERLPLYAAAAGRLEAEGRLYPCYETAEELDRRRKRQIGRGLPPVYDRAALALTAEDRRRLEAEGRRPHWRFMLDRVDVAWEDGIRGPSRIDCASLSDPVLVREDGSYLYTLPSVVDDGDLAVTDVIRGEDHVTNTAVQIQLASALGFAPSRYAHHNLLVTASGEGLSKRSGSLSLAGLRADGVESLAIAAFAVLTGTSDPVRPVADLDELAGLLDLAHVGRNPARFDPAELLQLSARTLHGLPFARLADRLAAAGISGEAAEPFWLAVRGNLARFDDIEGWWGILHREIAAAGEDAELLAAAAELLPPSPWDDRTWAAEGWRSYTAAIRERTGRKGRALFHPLRLALTGRDSGPELAALLPLIGRERAEARLRAAARPA